MNAEKFKTSEQLRNGVPVRIRAVQPADRVGMAEAFGKLDAESIYTRFFQHKPSLSDQELEAATEVDFSWHKQVIIDTQRTSPHTCSMEQPDNLT